MKKRMRTLFTHGSSVMAIVVVLLLVTCESYEMYDKQSPQSVDSLLGWFTGDEEPPVSGPSGKTIGDTCDAQNIYNCFDFNQYSNLNRIVWALDRATKRADSFNVTRLTKDACAVTRSIESCLNDKMYSYCYRVAPLGDAYLQSSLGYFPLVRMVATACSLVDIQPSSLATAPRSKGTGEVCKLSSRFVVDRCRGMSPIRLMDYDPASLFLLKAQNRTQYDPVISASPVKNRDCSAFRKKVACYSYTLLNECQNEDVARIPLILGEYQTELAKSLCLLPSTPTQAKTLYLEKFPQRDTPVNDDVAAAVEIDKPEKSDSKRDTDNTAYVIETDKASGSSRPSSLSSFIVTLLLSIVFSDSLLFR